MPMEIKDSAGDFERALVAQKPTVFILRLYVAGNAVHSQRAIQNLKSICNKYLRNRCDLKVIDIYGSPNVAKQEQILAVPTLVRVAPPPERRLVGDLSDRAHVLRFLN